MSWGFFISNAYPACEPSQYGGFLYCLQVQSAASFPSPVMMVGAIPVPLCCPSGPVATATVDHFEKWCESDMVYGASWNWTFLTGTPSTSSARNPSVVFNGLGQHLAIFEVTDIISISDLDSIYVSLSQATANDIQEGFEQAKANSLAYQTVSTYFS